MNRRIDITLSSPGYGRILDRLGLPEKTVPGTLSLVVFRVPGTVFSGKLAALVQLSSCGAMLLYFSGRIALIQSNTQFGKVFRAGLQKGPSFALS